MAIDYSDDKQVMDLLKHTCQHKSIDDVLGFLAKIAKERDWVRDRNEDRDFGTVEETQ